LKGNISLEKKSGKKKEKDKIFNTFIQLPLDIIQEDAPNALSWGLSFDYICNAFVLGKSGFALLWYELF